MVNIFILQELNAEPSHRIIHGLTTMIINVISPLIRRFKSRHLILMDGFVLEGRIITGYAVVDEINSNKAASRVSEILDAVYGKPSELYIRSVSEGYKPAQAMEAIIKQCFKERVAIGERK